MLRYLLPAQLGVTQRERQGQWENTGTRELKRDMGGVFLTLVSFCNTLNKSKEYSLRLSRVYYQCFLVKR